MYPNACKVSVFVIKGSKNTHKRNLGVTKLVAPILKCSFSQADDDLPPPTPRFRWRTSFNQVSIKKVSSALRKNLPDGDSISPSITEVVSLFDCKSVSL